MRVLVGPVAGIPSVEDLNPLPLLVWRPPELAKIDLDDEPAPGGAKPNAIAISPKLKAFASIADGAE